MIGNNNPFNIRYSVGNKWIGQNGCTRGFADFSSLDYGIRAACILIMVSYRKKDVVTIQEIIERFAPSVENNTQKYVDFVCSIIGCFPFSIPRIDEYPKLLNAMSIFEGNKVPIEDIVNVINEFNIKPYKCK